MSWTILVNTDAGHFKFWSFEVPTNGHIVYGRIGAGGNDFRHDSSVIQRKIQEKLSEGYVVFGENLDYYSPSPQQVNSFIRGGTSRETPTPLPIRTPLQPTYYCIDCGREISEREQHSERRCSNCVTINRRRMSQQENQETETVQVQEQTSVQRATERISRTRRTARTNYKTDAQGFIKNYDFNRPQLALTESLEFTERPLSEMNSAEKVAFNTYLLDMPSINRVNINSVQDAISSLEKFSAIVKRRKIIGIVSVGRSTGVSTVFYTKSEEANRRNIVKFMLLTIVGKVTSDNVQFRNLNATMSNEIEALIGRASGQISVRDMKERLGMTSNTNEPNRIINRWRE